MFDNLMVRSVLGKDAFFIAPGGINATHLADAKAVLSEFDLVLPLELIGRDMWEPLMLRLGWERPRSNSNGEPIGVRYKQNSINDKHHDGLFMKSHSREEIINAQWHNQTLRVRAWRLACSLVIRRITCGRVIVNRLAQERSVEPNVLIVVLFRRRRCSSSRTSWTWRCTNGCSTPSTTRGAIRRGGSGRCQRWSMHSRRWQSRPMRRLARSWHGFSSAGLGGCSPLQATTATNVQMQPLIPPIPRGATARS